LPGSEVAREKGRLAPARQGTKGGQAAGGVALGPTPPGTDFPEEWHEGVIDRVLEQGVARFVPVPAEVEAAIRAETRPEVWGGWPPRRKDIRGWQELMAGSSHGRRGPVAPEAGGPNPGAAPDRSLRVTPGPPG